MQVNYSYETDFRGTAGALKLAEHLIHEEDFFLMNGDSLFDIELRMLMHYHRKMSTTCLAGIHKNMLIEVLVDSLCHHVERERY